MILPVVPPHFTQPTKKQSQSHFRHTSTGWRFQHARKSAQDASFRNIVLRNLGQPGTDHSQHGLLVQTDRLNEDQVMKLFSTLLAAVMTFALAGQAAEARDHDGWRNGQQRVHVNNGLHRGWNKNHRAWNKNQRNWNNNQRSWNNNQRSWNNNQRSWNNNPRQYQAWNNGGVTNPTVNNPFGTSPANNPLNNQAFREQYALQQIELMQRRQNQNGYWNRNWY